MSWQVNVGVDKFRAVPAATCGMVCNLSRLLHILTHGAHQNLAHKVPIDLRQGDAAV